jgi:putative endonuclease
VGKFYYTYVLRSLTDGKLYVGWTDDLRLRLGKHNEGMVIATGCRTPFELVYYEACRTKESAIGREKTLKTGFGRKYLRDRIK